MDQVWLKVAADVPRHRQVFFRFCSLKTLRLLFLFKFVFGDSVPGVAAMWSPWTASL